MAFDLRELFGLTENERVELKSALEAIARVAPKMVGLTTKLWVLEAREPQHLTTAHIIFRATHPPDARTIDTVLYMADKSGWACISVFGAHDVGPRDLNDGRGP